MIWRRSNDVNIKKGDIQEIRQVSVDQTYITLKIFHTLLLFRRTFLESVRLIQLTIMNMNVLRN